MPCVAATRARRLLAIGQDGSVAAELDAWLSERDLDIEETTLDN